MDEDKQRRPKIVMIGAGSAIFGPGARAAGQQLDAKAVGINHFTWAYDIRDRAPAEAVVGDRMSVDDVRDVTAHHMLDEPSAEMVDALLNNRNFNNPPAQPAQTAARGHPRRFPDHVRRLFAPIRVRATGARPVHSIISHKEVAMPDHQALAHDDVDDVAVVIVDVSAGDEIKAVNLEGGAVNTVRAVEDIPLGHKIALRPMENGHEVIKYGRAIGRATSDIAQGAHVHVHNVKSIRWP